jgi:phospholipase C
VLGAGALAAGTGLVAACSSGGHPSAPGPSTTPSTARVVAAPTTTACPPAAATGLRQIEHVVVLMLENRSFDHYFGTYRGVRGFNDQGRFAQPPPPGGQGAVLPFHLDTITTGGSCTNDITHDWGPMHQAWNGGAMDGWAIAHAQADGPDGVTAMGYYTRADLPYYYALADAFTICDAYHCSVLGPTDPNRLFSMAATNDPAGAAGGPVLKTVDVGEAAKAKFSLSFTTMPERLESAGVSWKCYDNPAIATTSLSLAISDNRLYWFTQYADPVSSLYKKAFGYKWPDDFMADVRTGSLPNVSWVFAPPGYDEHPPSPPQAGEWLTNQLLGALFANPDVWAKTVVFITYDENGGFFDHVPPPVAPPGTAGEAVTVSPLPADAAGVARPVGLGFRVPMLVVSPFSRGGYVDSGTFDHTSMLRFLEARFGVEVPNLSAWRRSVTGDLTSTLDMGAPDMSVPSLPTATDGEVTPPRGCPPHEIITTLPTYARPTGAVPAQEPGAAKRRAPSRC